jgi:hypothetical protein
VSSIGQCNTSCSLLAFEPPGYGGSSFGHQAEDNSSASELFTAVLRREIEHFLGPLGRRQHDLSTAPLSTDKSQQMFLTTPHA